MFTRKLYVKTSINKARRITSVETIHKLASLFSLIIYLSLSIFISLYISTYINRYNALSLSPQSLSLFYRRSHEKQIFWHPTYVLSHNHNSRKTLNIELQIVNFVTHTNPIQFGLLLLYKNFKYLCDTYFDCCNNNCYL